MEKLRALLLVLCVLAFTSVAQANTQLDINYDADKLRTAWVDLPNRFSSHKEYPVVIVLHGGGGNGEQIRQMTQFDDLGIEGEFIAVFPYGHPAVGGSVFRSDSQEAQAMIWSGGPCCGEQLQDDVRYLDVLIDKLIRLYNVDKQRIYMVGHSNGGMMVHRYACIHGNRLAGIATNSGLASFKNCVSSRKPPPILHLHGEEDECLPLDGKECKTCNSRLIGGPIMYGGLSCKPVEETVRKWADQYECQGDPLEKEGYVDMSCKVWDKCKGGSSVTLCTIKHGGHNWPGGENVPLLCGKTSPQRCTDWVKMVGHVSAVRATDFIWNFLKMHKRP